MKFLAIDDSKLALAQIEHIIKEVFPSAEVIKIQDPKEGVKYVLNQNEEIAFVVVDYNMDSMTGIDIIDAIKHKVLPSKIALYTANTQASIKNEALNRGVNFIGKGDLKDKLKNLLTQTS